MWTSQARSTAPLRYVFQLALWLALCLPGFGQDDASQAQALLEKAQATFAEDGHEEEALELYDQALALDPDSVEARYARAECLEWLDRYDEALDAYQNLIKEDRASERANLAYAKAAMADGRYRKVTTCLTRFLRRVEGHQEALSLRAHAYYWRDSPTRAIADFQALEDLSESSADMEIYARALTENGQITAGVWAAERAVQLDPNSASAFYSQALALSASGDSAAARAAHERAVALDSDYKDYPYQYGAIGEPTTEQLLELYGTALKGFVIWGIVMGLIGLLVGLGGNRFLKPKEYRRRSEEASEGSSVEGDPTTVPRRRSIRPEYDGPAPELLRIYLQNVVWTILTLGVYRFWAKVRTKRFHYEHTQFAGGRFDYHATGREKFSGFLRGMCILAPIVVAYYYASEYADARPENLFLRVAATYGLFLAIYLIRPIALVGGQRFNLARTSWNNLRFRFTGTVGEAYALYLRDLLFMVLTLGIYYPWHKRNVEEFKLQNTSLGDEHMDFRGTGRELFGINFVYWIFTLLTLGFMVPWWIAARQRYFIENTRFMGKTFVSRISGLAVLGVGGPGLLVSILTLGLGLPWAITRWRTLLAVTTTYMGDIDAQTMSSIADAAATSTLEGIGEAGDFVTEIGDIFGV